jgi:hypothetical protein
MSIRELNRVATVTTQYTHTTITITIITITIEGQLNTKLYI